MRSSRLRPAALILAALSLVLAIGLTGGASGATQNIGPYTVTDTVTHDLQAGTTTFTYEVVAPNTQGVKDISHLNVQVCGAPTFVAGSPNQSGTLENGDPSTGQTGPIVKWPNQQNVGTTVTYSFTVQGLFQPTPVTMQLKNQDLFEGTVQGLSCDPLNGTLIVDKVTNPAGDPQLFDFAGPAGAFQLADGSTPQVISVTPGSHVVTETSPAGWDFTSATCDDGDSTQTAPGEVTAIVASGETVTCTFTNTKQQSPPPPGEPDPPIQEQPPLQPQQQPPGEQEVLGDRVPRGQARLAGATGCRKKPFKMSVRGSQIRRVVFSIDGKRVKTVRKSQNGRVYSITIRPRRYSEGSHLVTARVRFTEASNTPSKRLRARFVRCARRVAPAFTG
jgi:hypothetical protein